jgi:hypothetical protein
MKATIGSISHGTMRLEHLIPDFIAACRALGVKVPTGKPRQRDIERETEEAQEFCNALLDALDAAAPDGCYFGAHPGDGSDYGFWPDDDSDLWL